MDSFLASGVLRGLQLRKFEVLTFGVSHSAAFLAHAQTLPNSKKRCLTLMEDTVITLSQGWFKASVSVILFFGSTVSIFFTKSIAVWKQMDLAVKQKRRLSKAVAYLVSTSTFFSFFFFFFFFLVPTFFGYVFPVFLRIGAVASWNLLFQFHVCSVFTERRISNKAEIKTILSLAISALFLFPCFQENSKQVFSCPVVILCDWSKGSTMQPCKCSKQKQDVQTKKKRRILIRTKCTKSLLNSTHQWHSCTLQLHPTTESLAPDSLVFHRTSSSSCVRRQTLTIQNQWPTHTQGNIQMETNGVEDDCSFEILSLVLVA